MILYIVVFFAGFAIGVLFVSLMVVSGRNDAQQALPLREQDLVLPPPARHDFVLGENLACLVCGTGRLSQTHLVDYDY